STITPKVSPAYFQSLGVPLLRGRFFNDHDTADSLPVTIISESLARRYFQSMDPLGHRLKQSGPNLQGSPYMEIVGVVGDVKYGGLDSVSDVAYYQAYSQNQDR